MIPQIDKLEMSMKVSELIERLNERPQDQEVVVFLDGPNATIVPVQGVGDYTARDGAPEQTAIAGFSG